MSDCGAVSGESAAAGEEDSGVFFSGGLSVSEMVMMSTQVFATASRQSAMRIWAWSETDSSARGETCSGFRTTASRASRTSSGSQ